MRTFPAEVTTDSMILLCEDLAVLSKNWKVMRYFKWSILTPFQVRHPEFNRAIAAYASHVLDKHLWCGDRCNSMLAKAMQSRMEFPASNGSHTAV